MNTIPDLRQRPEFRLGGLVLFLGTALLFARSLGYGFLNYDDPDYVVENALVHGGITWAGVKQAFSAPVLRNWHPLTMLSYMAEWELSGGNAALFHLSNVLWHATNALLVFSLFQRLGIQRFVALFCAALFAWHPLRVESVVWIAERKDVLSGFFFLCTLLLYLHYRRSREEGTHGWGWYLATLASFGLGLLCKSMLVTVPGVLLLLDFLLWRRNAHADSEHTPWRLHARGVFRAVVEKVPFFALSFIFSILTLATQHGLDSPVISRSWWSRIGTALAALPQYLVKTVWPADLIPLYPLPAKPPGTWVCAGLLFVAVSITICLWQWRRRPWVTVGWLWFVGMLIPVLGLVQVGVQSMADRYTYLPGLGLLLMVGFGAAEIGRRVAVRRRMAVAATAIVALAALSTLRQQDRWKDSITLWEHTVAHSGANPIAHFNLGNAYLSAGRYAEAERELREAIAGDIPVPFAYTNLGIVLAIQGRPREALVQLETAESLGVSSPKIYFNLARILIGLGRYDEAIARCRMLLDRWPGLPAAEALLLEATEYQRKRDPRNGAAGEPPKGE